MRCVSDHAVLGRQRCQCMASDNGFLIAFDSKMLAINTIAGNGSLNCYKIDTKQTETKQEVAYLQKCPSSLSHSISSINQLCVVWLVLDAPKQVQ